MDKPQRKHAIRTDALQEPHYFESLLREARLSGLVSESEWNLLQIQLGSLLAAQSLRYTRGESSSVKIETAQNLLQSIFYSIGAYLKTIPDPEAGIARLKEFGASELFRMGQNRIQEKLKNANTLYTEISASRIRTKNIAYNDTLDSGIPAFFSGYDPEFGGHETPGMIDYPAGGPPIRAAGVDYMEEYLGRLLLESRLCSKFSAEQIHAVMSRAHPGYEELLLNIGEVIEAGLLPDGTLPDLPAEDTPAPAILFEDGKAMEDEVFRQLTEELRSCRYVSDKLALLRRHLPSFSDLLDLLDADCFFEEEYSAFFPTLEDGELALLFQCAAEAKELCFFRDEPQKRWQLALFDWLNAVDAERRSRIELLSGQIERCPKSENRLPI